MFLIGEFTSKTNTFTMPIMKGKWAILNKLGEKKVEN